MEAKQRQEQGRQHDHVEGEETLDGELADLGTAAQHIGNHRADEGNGDRNLKADLGGEVAELVHGQQVAGEAEDGGQAEQRHAAEPSKLTRLAVGLHKEDREHMHEDGEQHQVGGPGMRRTDEPAEVHDEGDLANRFVGFRTGAVIDQQQYAGKALDKEEEQRDAAPVIPERLGVNGNRLVVREGSQLGEAQALIDPFVSRSRDGL